MFTWGVAGVEATAASALTNDILDGTFALKWGRDDQTTEILAGVAVVVVTVIVRSGVICMIEE